MNLNRKLTKEELDDETRIYFSGITSKPILSVPVLKENDEILATPSVATILWIFEEYKLNTWIDLTLIFDTISTNSILQNNKEIVLNSLDQTQNPLQFQFRNQFVKLNFERNSASNLEQVDSLLKTFGCELTCRVRPLVIVKEKRFIISGLSSILRFLFKFSKMKLKMKIEGIKEDSCDNSDLKNQYDSLQNLMGFRGGCLQACAEVSVWTKFCEIDIIESLESSVRNINSTTNTLSKDVLRFEYHLLKPVKMHNIRKEASLINKHRTIEPKSTKKDEVESDNNKFGLEHEFAEGPYMVLSDLVLYPLIHLLIQFYERSTFQKHLPNVLRWYMKLDNIFNLSKGNKLMIHLRDEKTPCDINSTLTIPEIPKESLYKSDKTRYNSSSRLFTKQEDIEGAINSFISSGFHQMDIKEVISSLNWVDIPLLAQPEGGNLPIKRREKKGQQLSGIIVEVMKVVKKIKENCSSSRLLKIVDFCSGGGHVGILLAWLLPECQIILVENKEESLRRGWERITKLQLNNVTSYQCNLDYFDGQFDIGVALHACGTATDLVLSKCIAATASFVVCPCCYGAIQSNHMLHYPRSERFNENIPLKHYFILAHASDQTQTDDKNQKTEQGKFCMQLIDTDRCWHAQENGYFVYLTKILPETASPKNHIIVGISNSNANHGL